MNKQDPWIEVERRSGTYHFGHEEGLLQGRKEVIFELLAERGIAVDEQSEAQICGCNDIPTLQRWVRRAVRAASIAELFEDG